MVYVSGRKRLCLHLGYTDFLPQFLDFATVVRLELFGWTIAWTIKILRLPPKTLQYSKSDESPDNISN